MKGFGSIGLKGYRPLKAAQASAYFVNKDGGSTDKLKLIKLLYLAERESMRRRARPMLYDEMYSLPHGPICSNALNGINGESDRAIWSRYVKLMTNRKTVRAVKHDNNLDHVSKSDLDILKAVWAEFGHMTASQIRKWTHDNCEEYTDIEEGRVPISYRDVFSAVGQADPAALEDTVREYRRVEATLEA